MGKLIVELFKPLIMETKALIAFQSFKQMEDWQSNNCEACAFNQECALQKKIAITMEVEDARKAGYEDMGFGMIALEDKCRKFFPKSHN